MILELHVIQNFAPANLNRDDTGTPKDAIFGGYRRARVSSQSWKRAIRKHFENESQLDGNQLGVRSKRVVNYLQNTLSDSGRPEDQAQRVAIALLQGLGLKANQDEDTGEWLTEYLLFLGTTELEALARVATSHWDALVAAADQAGTGNKKSKKATIPEEVQSAAKAALTGSSAADLALFGRMLADLPDKNIDGAAQVAHAISTNAVEFQYDYFTAVDDLNTRDEPGAGMIGDVGFNSATFYRYTNVDVNALITNLDGNAGLAQDTLRAYAEAFLVSIPTGKQNSFAAQNLPTLAVAIVREKGRWALTNAFVNPAQHGRDRDLVADSIDKLGRHWNALVEMYGRGEKVTPIVLCDPAYKHQAKSFCDDAETCDQLVTNIDIWLTRIDEALQTGNQG